MASKKAPLVAAAFALVLGSSCIGYPALKLRWARRTVGAFCASVRPGDPVGELAVRARAAGLDVIDSPARPGHPATLMAWQGWAFSRLFCNVEHEGGRAVRTSTSSLD